MTCAFDEQHLGEMVGGLTKMFFNLSGFVGGGSKLCPHTIEEGAKIFDTFAHLCANHEMLMDIAKKTMSLCVNTHNFSLDLDVDIVPESLRRTACEVREIVWTQQNSTIHMQTAMNVLFFTNVLTAGLKTSIKMVK
jgi:hypothetical protein